ncbi:MAG: hemolysin family protein [Phycisphaerales bacterium]|nr:hemolysin family protein [Phycisphaerales bacterium]
MSEPPQPEVWTALDGIITAMLPLVLACSAFFSGAETALFSLSARQRLDMGRGHSAVSRLLAKPRMLLITLLLGNMLANVLYFVLASVLTWNQPWGTAGMIIMPLATLLILVALGEVAPKMIASAHAPAIARLIAPPLLAVHRTILPLRLAIDRAVVQPLSRLATPSSGATTLSLDELGSLLDHSGREGVVDLHEQRLLSDVLTLGERRVSDVMTPRTRMISIASNADDDAVNHVIAAHRFMRIPIHGRDLDDIQGFLHVKDWLRNPGNLNALMRQPRYLPEATNIEQAMDTLRKEDTQIAIVVDEYGGTAGIVALHDLIEPLIGEIVDDAHTPVGEARPLGPGRWTVPGDFPAGRLTKAMQGAMHPIDRASTVGGLVTRTLGRPPEVGDQITIGNVQISVHHVSDGHVVTAIVSLEESGT